MCHIMGFLKKLKDVAEKGVEKGADLGTKAYDEGKKAETRLDKTSNYFTIHYTIP